MKLCKKLLTASILTISFFITGCADTNQLSTNPTSKPVIGAVMSSFDDTWKTSVRNELYEMAQDKAEINIWSADNSQEIENKKIDILIDNKVNVLVVNLVDKSAAASIIEKAKKADIPIIFFNIEPSEQDLKLWDKAYYVGAKGEQSGMMQGQILANYFKNTPPEDGVVNYVMIKGPDGNSDAASRSQYSIEAIEKAGLRTEKLSEGIAAWDREKSQEKMKDFITAYGDNIDCVIANNDDMALGSIDTLKEKGYFKNGKFMPVVGVDGNNSTINFLNEGTLLGTVLNDASGQGKAIFNLSTVLINRESPSKDNYNNTITDNKYIWIDYKTITKTNISDIK